jgi:hypothetical protein
MPRKKQVKKLTKVRHEMIDTKTEGLLPAKPTLPSEVLRDPGKASSFRWGVVVVLFIITLGVYLATRGYIVAAMVEGKPIFAWDVNRAVMSRYAAQTLESMISERLIAETAQKQNVVITKSDVDSKINDLVKSLGSGVSIDDLLKYQGVKRAEFESQVKLQLAVEKILGKDIAITESDIDDYIAKNRDTLTATDEASMREEAKQTIFSQKMSEKIQPWFADLKEKAKITRFLK